MADPVMAICPNCGQANEPGAELCANCSSVLQLPAPDGAPVLPYASAKKSAPRLKPALLKYLVIAAAVVAFFGILGAPTDLVCRRLQAGGPVNCAQATRLLWIIPLPPRHIENVQHAQVGESSDGSSRIYRVEIGTVDGMAPLTSGYTSGRSAKQDVVDEINELVVNGGPGTITVTEPGLLSPKNLFCMLVWLVVWGAGSMFWNVIKSGAIRPARAR